MSVLKKVLVIAGGLVVLVVGGLAVWVLGIAIGEAMYEQEETPN